jgi:hypothetical protein
MATTAHSHHDLTMRLRSIIVASRRGGLAFLLLRPLGHPGSQREIGSDAHLERYTASPTIRESWTTRYRIQRAAEIGRSGRRERIAASEPSLSLLSARRCVRSGWSHPAGLDFVHGRPQSADVRQISVTLGVVEPIADDELVRDVEADIFHRYLHLDRVGFA